MARHEWYEFHCVTVENLSVATVCNNDNEIAFIFLFPAWFWVLDVDDFIVKTDDCVKGWEVFGIDKGQILLCRHNDKLLVGERNNFKDPIINSFNIASDFLFLIVQIDIEHFGLLSTKN